MQLHRDQSGQIINRIFNDPRIKAQMFADDRYLDLSKLAQDPRAYAMIGDPPLGAYVLWPIVEGVYEFHVGVLPRAHGAWTVDFSDSTISFMFCATDCIELITRIPQGAVASRALSRRFGFRERWEYSNQEIAYTVVSLTLFDWLPSDDGMRGQVFAAMEKAGMGKKATSWYQRWALLSSAGQAIH
jgi:hypothetical protein